ncbi:hypothetical protein CSUI_003823 [Cystoisospora suis]|uniref:Uncharacterized protein n=1 Tax=Cystoisospora suis TaxID=483139 RepID=A0A2C6L3L9_9APIC|nr:hypothetical protein CSUI_003823 [Cystoisospora suis]
MLGTRDLSGADEMFCCNPLSGAGAPATSTANHGGLSTTRASPQVTPAPSPGPPPLTLRDFLQLLGESVAVLEGVRLLLLQLLQWGGDVGSLLRSSILFQKTLSFLSLSFSRLVRLPFALLYFLFGKTGSLERSPFLTRTTRDHDGDRRFGVLQRAWREALLPAATPSALPAISLASGLYGGKGEHGLLQGGTDTGTKRRSATGWLTTMMWLASSNQQPGGSGGSRLGRLVYALLVFGVAYRLCSLWKKYRRLLSDYKAVVALLRKQRAAAAAAEQARGEREKESSLNERQRLLESFFQSFCVHSSSPFSPSSDRSRGRELTTANRAVVGLSGSRRPSGRGQTTSAEGSTFLEEKNTSESDDGRSSSPRSPHFPFASSSSSTVLPSSVNEPLTQTRGSPGRLDASLGEELHRIRGSSSTCSSTCTDQSEQDQRRLLPVLICDELEAIERKKAGAQGTLLASRGSSTEEQICPAASDSLSREVLSSVSSSTKAPSATNTQASTPPRGLTKGKEVPLSFSSCSLAPSLGSFSSSSSRPFFSAPFSSACNAVGSSCSVFAPLACSSHLDTFSTAAFSDTLSQHPLQPQRRFGAEERLSEPLFDDNPFLALVSSEIAQGREKFERNTRAGRENTEEGSAGMPAVPVQSCGRVGSESGTGASSVLPVLSETGAADVRKDGAEGSGDEKQEQGTEQASTTADDELFGGGQASFPEVLASVPAVSETEERQTTGSRVTADFTFLPSSPCTSSASRRISFCSTVPSVSSSCTSTSSSSSLCTPSPEPPPCFPLSAFCLSPAMENRTLSKFSASAEDLGKQKTRFPSSNEGERRSHRIASSEHVTLECRVAAAAPRVEDCYTSPSGKEASKSKGVASSPTGAKNHCSSQPTSVSGACRPIGLASSLSGSTFSVLGPSGCTSALTSTSSLCRARGSRASSTILTHKVSDSAARKLVCHSDSLLKKGSGNALRTLSVQDIPARENEGDGVRPIVHHSGAAQPEEGKTGYRNKNSCNGHPRADTDIHELKFPDGGVHKTSGRDRPWHASGGGEQLVSAAEHGGGRMGTSEDGAASRDVRLTDSRSELCSEAGNNQVEGETTGELVEQSTASDQLAGSAAALPCCLAVRPSSVRDTASHLTLFVPVSPSTFPSQPPVCDSSAVTPKWKATQDKRNAQSTTVSMFSVVS